MGLLTSIAVGTTLASTGLSFAQAGKQNTLAKDAEASATKAFEDAQKQLDVNYYEQLGLSKTPYENQREAIAQAGAQAIEAAGASERGGAATAGRVLAQSNIAQQGITDQQTKDLQALNKLVVAEDANLASKRGELSLAQAEGAGIAAAQAENLKNQSIMSGVQGLANAGMSLYENSELYKQNPTTPGSTTPASNNAASFGVFASDVNPSPQVDASFQLPSSNSSFELPSSQNTINPNSFGVLANNANPYPQVVPSQNMMTPAQQFQNTANNFNSANLIYNPFKVY